MMRRLLANARAWIHRLRLSLASGIDDWESAELWVQHRMAPSIVEYRRLAHDLDDAAYEITKEMTSTSSSLDLCSAHIALLARVLQDLRVADGLMARGYTMQGWAITASAFEAAHTMGYLAADPSRAVAWWQHSDPRSPFCGARTAVEGCFKYLEIGNQGAQRVRLIGREYRHYEHLCVAKHINPVSERSRYLSPSPRGTVVRFTPTVSSRRRREARFGLALACRAAITALWVFQRAQIPGDEKAARLVVDLGVRAGSVLANWNDPRDAA